MSNKKLLIISAILYLILMVFGCSVKAQPLNIKIIGWDHPTVDTEVYNTTESIDYFCTKTLKPFFKDECLEELFVYYKGKRIAMIYAGDPERPFYVEGITEFEYFEMDSCLLQIFKSINNGTKNK